MRLRRAILVSVFVMAGLTGPVPVSATPPPGQTGPAAAWLIADLGEVGRDPCIPSYGLAKCTRYGGLAMHGSTALLLGTDGGSAGELGTFEYAEYRRSVNGGASFGPSDVFSTNVEGPDTTTMPAMAQRAMAVDVVYEQASIGKPVRVRHSDDLGQTFGSARRLPRPRQVITNLAIANGPGGRVAVAIAAFDEATTSRPSFAIDIHVSTDSGSTFSVSRRFAWTRGYCFALGTDPSITITKNGTIVLAYWRTCRQLVVRRSRDGGRTWSSPRTLSTGSHALGMAIATRRNTVVLAYTAGGATLTRRSVDAGATWSSPRSAGSGAESLRLVHAGGMWRLLAGGTDRIRYRTSTTGLAWSAGETIIESIGARTYALGVAYGTGPLTAFAVRTPDKRTTLYVARR